MDGWRRGQGVTHGKLRINGLVGDIVGNVLDLRIVLAGLGGHGGRTRQS